MFMVLLAAACCIASVTLAASSLRCCFRLVTFFVSTSGAVSPRKLLLGVDVPEDPVVARVGSVLPPDRISAVARRARFSLRTSSARRSRRAILRRASATRLGY